MAYKNTKKKYKTRKEKLRAHLRNYSIIFVFVLIALVLLALTQWNTLSFYFKTYFVY